MSDIFSISREITTPNERELYTLYAGRNLVELGHVFKSASVRLGNDEVPEGMLRVYGIHFDKVQVKEGYHTVDKEVKLVVELNPDVIKSWEDLTRVPVVSSVTIARRHDKKWMVQVSVPDMSNYTVGLLDANDIIALLEEAEIAVPVHYFR